jgi:hypothetical protein
MGQVAYLITGEARVAAALSRPRDRDQLEADALNKYHWGNRRGESPHLPCTAWTQIGTVEKGGWGDRRVEPVVIRATVGLDKGVWYRIRQGIAGVVVQDERGCPRVYVLCEPSTHYYQVMTRGSRWMPKLIDELI